MTYKETHEDQYVGHDIRVFGRETTHILYEWMGNMVYLHEWRNSRRDRDGIELGKLFLKRFRNVPIVCSTLKDSVVKVARRYGFDIYKRVNDRIFMIRRS